MRYHSGFACRIFALGCILLLSFGLVIGENHTLFYRASGFILNRNYSKELRDQEAIVRRNLSQEVFVAFQDFIKIVFSNMIKDAKILNITNKAIYFSPPSKAEAENSTLIVKEGNVFEEPEIGVYFLMLIQFDFDIEKQAGSTVKVKYVIDQLKTIDMYLRRRIRDKPVDWLSRTLYVNSTCIIFENLPETEAHRMEDVLMYKIHFVPKFVHQSGGISKTNLLVLSILSYVGCGLSLFGLILTVTTIIFSRKLRRVRANQILVQMCVALLGTLLFYTLGIRQIKDQSQSETCKAISAMLHYFVLASMVWASIEAYNLYQDLVKVFDTSVLTQNEFMCRVSLVGWVLPGIVVGATVIASKTSYGFLVSDTEETLCWMTRDAFYFALLLPVLLLVLVNLVFFVIVMREIFKMPQAHEKHSKMSQLRATISVFILLGLNWIFAGLAATSPTLVFQYLFTITCSFQGFLIFVLHGIMKKDFQEAWKLLSTQNRVMEVIRSSHLSQRTTSSSISRNSMVPTSSIAYGNTNTTKCNIVGDADSGIDLQGKNEHM